ncbi:MAG TPA: hypothetical protein VML75_17510, partial [Kofleriaceae bacterium]|nr:hypothetical protein [Kofleriaceae bacterium]
MIHPAVAIETGVDTNVFYEDRDPIAAPLVRLLLSFALASQDHKLANEAELQLGDEPEPTTPPTLSWRLGGLLAAEQYLSGNDAVSDRSNLGGHLKLDLTAFPAGDVSFDVRDHFIRDTRPQNFETR